MVLMDGTICRFGGKTLDQEGYDLMGLICGSEGLAWCRYRSDC
jgi:glycolate oxidase